MEKMTETGNAESKRRIAVRPKPNETAVIVINSGFILFLQLLVIYVYCS